jgi:hypothetical protein
MVTLEMVPLRATLPTGRVTLRHAMPAFNPAFPDDLTPHDLMTRIEDVLAAHDTAAPETSTTPQVGASGDSPAEAETTAGKGGGAR